MIQRKALWNYIRSQKRCITIPSRLNRPISVAPMVDITTSNFLELLYIISGERHTYYSEMHHANAIINHKSHLHRFVGTPRTNLVVQLGGSDPTLLANAASILEKNGYSEVNINIGCPSPNVQSGNFGAVLMKTPDLVADILSSMKVSIPVTIKCRIGVDHLDSFEFFHQFVENLMQCKRSPPHLIVHARKCILKGLTPKQNRSIPPLNYERVYKLASIYPDLPITINGGFSTIYDINTALQKVDGCMIGRKIMNSPLFLQDIDRYIYQIDEKDIKSPVSIIEEYLDYSESLLATDISKDESYGLPPISLLIKPLMMLFQAKQGRSFRRHLFDQLQQSKQSSINIRKIVTQSLENAGIH